MKRVLIFSTAYFPFVGGAEVAVKEITDRLPEMEFVMITVKLDSKLKEVEKVGNIEVHRIGKGNNWDKCWLVLKGPILALKLGHFDAIWGIMASYAGFAALRFKKQNLSIPFLLTLQEGDSRLDIYKHVWWCWPYFKQIFKRADKIQAISNYLAQWAKDLGARCPIQVIPNGVKIQNVVDSAKNSDLKRVITVSRLVKKNDVKSLIQAINILNKDYHQPVVLKILGDGKLKNRLKKLIKNLKLDQHIVLLGKKEFKETSVELVGEVAHKEVYSRLIQADVFVRPSLSEGLGNAFLEAMATGVPVIGTNVGGIPDFLKDGETGLFCNVKDPQDIAKQIKRIFDNPIFAEKLRVNGRKLVEEKYNWDLIADKFKIFFNF
jgi:glycosyltransferase involved in cell wall biosynthesis